MITGIRLKNWRSHLNSELQFSSGTNALLGHMGSGKTTILDSICFGLFGTFPMLQSKKIKLDDLVMNKPSIKDLSEVEVFFQVNGKDYSVKRVIEKRKGTTYSEVRENGKLLEAPSTQRVNEFIERLLKVNYDLFSKAIYSEQNALDYFLTIPKGQRMKKIDELLMIDKFEKARSNTVALNNKIQERKISIQSVLDKVKVDNIDSTLRDLKTSVETLISEKIQNEKTLRVVAQQKGVLEEELRRFRRIKEDFEVLVREERGVASAVDELSRSLDKLSPRLTNVDKETLEENLKSSAKTLNEITQLLELQSEEYQRISSQYSKYRTEAEVYKRETIERLDKEIKDRLSVQKEIEFLKKKIGKDPNKELEKKKLLIEKFVGEMEALKIKIDDIAEIVDQLQSVKAKCPVCDAKLTEEKKVLIIKTKRQQITELRKRLEDSYKQKEINESELRQLNNAIESLNELLTKIADLDKLTSDLKSANDIYKVLYENSSKMEKELIFSKEKLASVQKKLEEIKNSKSELDLLSVQLRDYIASKSRIDELAKQRNLLRSHLQELEKTFVGKDIRKIESDLMELVGKERELSAKIDSFDQVIVEKEARLKELQTAFSSISKEKEELKKLDDLNVQLKLFEKSLEATQIQLRQEFITAVNYSMDQLWQTLYPYQDFTGIRLNVEEGDYVLQLQARNEWVNVEGIVSGGERSLAALTLRVALSLILAPHLRILFLDEPTANLDAKAVSELATTLRERIHEFIDQTFIITHQSELEDAVTGHAYRLERDKANDGYTEVVELN